MNRFSPKQTLSNFVTAVRETVDSVNKKTFAAVALIALASVVGASELNAQAKQETAAERAKADVQAKKDAEESYETWLKKKNYEKKERTDALEEVKAKCTFPKGSTPSEEAIDACKDAQGVAEGFNPGRTRIDEREERKKSQYESSCEKAADKLKTELGLAQTACNDSLFGGDMKKCADKVLDCKHDEGALDDPDDESPAGAYCDKALANRCPGLSVFNDPQDYKSEVKEAKQDQKELKRDLNKLMKQQREEEMDLATKQREIQENLADEQTAARDAERQVADDLKEALTGLSASQKKAFESAQEAYTNMEVEYIKMRKEARDSADMVMQAKDDLQVMCRGSAEKKYQEAEKGRLAALALRKKNLGAGTNVSGAAKRTKAATQRARQSDFLAFFNECHGGASADGVGGNNRIKTAERAKASADKLLADKSAMIEKQRLQMLDKLKAMEAEAENKKSEIVEAAQKQLVRQEEKRADIARKNAGKAADFAQKQRLTMESTRQELETVNRDLMTAQREENVASTRMACLGRNATRTEARKDKLEKGYGDILGAISEASTSCQKMDKMVGLKRCDPEDKPGKCADILAAAKAKGTSGGRVGQ